MRKQATKRILALTDKDEDVRRKYVNAGHKQLGNLHERMKWLIGCKESLREYVEKSKDAELFTLVQALGVAVMDLETELSFYEPANPPYARRNNNGHSSPIVGHYKNPSPTELVMARSNGKSKRQIKQ